MLAKTYGARPSDFVEDLDALERLIIDDAALREGTKAEKWAAEVARDRAKHQGKSGSPFRR